MKRNLAKFLTMSAAFVATMPLLQNCSFTVPGLGDVYFDERTGEVSAYEIVRPDRPSGSGGRRIIPVEACPAIADVMVVSEVSA